MTYEPSPKQALLIWKMITGASHEEREPLQSKTRPELSAKERKALADNGFVTLEPPGKKQGLRLVLTDKAWAWAEAAGDVDLFKSRSSVGAEALQGLLRRLLPFLRREEIPLSNLFAEDSAPAEGREGATPAVESTSNENGSSDSKSLPARIEAECLSLSGGARQERVRLSALRHRLKSVQRGVLDAALLNLQDQRQLVLYRDDNTAALTEDDRDAALLVGGEPRHLVYLEA